ncbi:MAG: AAA family ATPase [Oscillospiraceae bacterium]|nr:AAA family ATPase [Oscillospiraceae bacterium]
MGIYLNPGNDLFAEAANSEIYVDKTMLIGFTNKVIGTSQKHICVSRPRRFGKSIAENMLVAYYSKGCDSDELFSRFKISKAPDYEKHLNQYNVIHVDIQNFSKYTDIAKLISRLTQELIFDIKLEFPECALFDESDLVRSLKDNFAQTKQKFIIIIDEWDCIFRIYKNDGAAQKVYLDFLRDLLKGQPYVALAYMTGILPIKKYGEHSALNMFDEYSMTNQRQLAEFTGFTEAEVESLCVKYNVKLEEVKQWYDGYNVSGIPTYNPRSVVSALMSHVFDNYWSQTESYEALKVYIQRNENGLRDKIIQMIGGAHIPVNTKKFQNDMCTFESADDVLTLLIHLGYLTYDFDTKTAWIPNSEVRQEFVNSISDTVEYKKVSQAIEQSDRLLNYTLKQDAERVAGMIAEIHNDNVSVIRYNDENSLACVLTLAYYSAQDTYAVYRELHGGEGFADLVFVPRRGNSNPAMIVELKWDKNAGLAIAQIKDKGYVKCLKDYEGTVLFVGINYDKKTKKHECRFETVEI